MAQRSTPTLGSGAPRRSGVLAAILSFFIPGLGQIYAGQFVRGLIIAIPQTVVIFAFVWLQLNHQLADTAILKAFSFAVVFALMLVYRGWAVLDAYLVATRDSSKGLSARSGVAASVTVVAMLLIVNTVTFGYFAYTAYVGDRAIHDVVNCQNELHPASCPNQTNDPNATPTGTPGPTPTLPPGESPTATIDFGGSSDEPTITLPPIATPDPGDTATPNPTVDPTLDWSQDGVLNVLLLGVDEGPGGSRNQGIRTDSMMVLSVDVKTGRSALFGVPRNALRVPLPPDLESIWPCNCFPKYLFGFGTFFQDGDIRFKNGDNDSSAPYQALRETIGYALGLQIDGIVKVNLIGFVKAVDALGGVDINVPQPGVVDTAYRDENNVSTDINIKPGPQHMNGHIALEFVRSRHQDSDYGRMNRQQIFLRAVRQELTFCNLIPKLPDLISAVGQAVSTDFPLEEFPQLLDLVSRSKQPRRFEFTPPTYAESWSDPVNLAKIRLAVTEGFAATAGNPDPAEPDESLPPPPQGNC